MDIRVFTQSAIKISGDGKNIYFDPYSLKFANNDADIIFFTHDHYDHFSPEDIAKVSKDNTIFVSPEKMTPEVKKILKGAQTAISVKPYQKIIVDKTETETVPAYNKAKAFHPKSSGFVGYVITVEGKRLYVAGDTDDLKENEKINCDICFIPIGGTFTMDAMEAAEFVNRLKPKTAIPIHYGSIVGKKEDQIVFKNNVDSGINVKFMLFD